jgi:hypothetical protein
MKRAILTGLTMLVLGCSQSSAATNQVNSALAAVESAKSAGADKIPEAKPALAMAETDVQRAQNALKGGDYKNAQTAASSAYESAEEALKIAKSKAGKSAPRTAAVVLP